MITANLPHKEFFEFFEGDLLFYHDEDSIGLLAGTTIAVQLLAGTTK